MRLATPERNMSECMDGEMRPTCRCRAWRWERRWQSSATTFDGVKRCFTVEEDEVSLPAFRCGCCGDRLLPNGLVVESVGATEARERSEP
jgi:hypothetical protein